MITGRKEELDGTIKTHQCPEHPDKELTVTWQAKENAYIIACGGGHFPLEVTPKTSLTQALRRGELEEGKLKHNVQKGAERRRGGMPATVDKMPLGLMSVTDFGDGHNITLVEVERAVSYARRVDLDIRLGHVCLYHGKPYPTIDGYLYYARRSNKPYKLLSSPLTEQEKKDYQVGALDYAWKCNVHLVLTGEQFSGIGIVTDAERTAKSERNPNQLRSPVVAAKPWQMAQKRAEWQALRRAFPLGTEEQNDKDEGANRPAAEKL